MSKEIPVHLKEIIDKGFNLSDAQDALSLEFGSATIPAHSSAVTSNMDFGTSKKLRVAFCFDGPFLPVRNGASYSLFNLLQTLGEEGQIEPILLLCYRGTDSPRNYANKNFRTLFVTPEHYYEEDGFIEKIFEVNDINTVQFCSSEGLLNLGPRLKRQGAKVVFDIQNIDHILEERLGHENSLVEKAKRLQVEAIQHSDYILCRSEIDKSFAVGMGATPDKTGVYNGAINVDSFAFAETRENPKSLVFLAHMYYEPNENAFKFITEQLLPRLPSDYTLTVIGITPKRITDQHGGNTCITFKQDVDDISTELLAHGIALAPIFEGSGTRLKVLDYLASGIPVVATELAVEGLKHEITEVISVCESADEFTNEIQRVTANPAKLKRRSKKGRAFVESHYDWKSQIAPFLRAYAND